MKISCNILKKHIKGADTIDFLSVWDKFTIRTAEVENVEIKGSQFDKVITAKIIECENHPNSKKLHILKVDTGKEVLQIVCGAPNVRVGLVGALIRVGGHIDGIEIGVRPLAGVESYGMMCSGKELGISDDHSGIIEFDENTKLGVDIKSLFPIEDIIVEIDNKSLTHRPDLWGHYGIAREIAAITGHELLPLDLDKEESDLKPLKINVNNPDLCYRYIGTKLNNIENKKTPLWMQIFLYYAGMRSINLIVDLTNYIMLELGQPMHAFDERKVKNIEVGLAKTGDKYTTLDGVERNLTNEDLMIKNGGEYFAIAGVMGGLDSEIVADTDGIILESATFESSTVRKTAIRLGLRTEASSRYEKSLDPNLAMIATKRFIKLLKEENPNLQLGSKITDVYCNVQNENKIELDKEYLYKYMGFNIEDGLVIKILTSLGFKVTNNKKSFKIVVPTFRSTKDITIAADIIEEISRMYGYENFNHEPLKMDMTFGNPEIEYDMEYEVKNYLVNRYNLNEVHSYLWNKTTFLKKINVEVNNVSLLGKTDDNVLRNDLNLSLLEAANVNINNYDEFGIFEIGTVIINNEAKRKLSIMLVKNESNLKEGYYRLKEIIASLFKSIKNIDIKYDRVTSEEYYNPDLTLNILCENKNLGSISVFNYEISKEISKKKSFICASIDFDEFINQDIKPYIYEDISKYPTVSLDYTIITKRGVFYSNIEEVLNGFNSPIVIKRTLKDIYLEEASKKITINYLVGSKDKTLTSEELEKFKKSFILYIKENGFDIKE